MNRRIAFVTLLVLSCSCRAWGQAPRAATPGDQLKLPAGFKAELLVSATPEQGTWVCMAVDDRGRLYLSPQYDREAKEFIVATEAGILHQMMKASPDKTFIPAPPDNSCACNDCPHMKRNTLEKIYLCMKYELPDIIMDEDLRKAALKPIQRMMEISAAAGL